MAARLAPLEGLIKCSCRQICIPCFPADGCLRELHDFIRAKTLNTTSQNIPMSKRQQWYDFLPFAICDKSKVCDQPFQPKQGICGRILGGGCFCGYLTFNNILQCFKFFWILCKFLSKFLKTTHRHKRSKSENNKFIGWQNVSPWYIWCLFLRPNLGFQGSTSVTKLENTLPSRTFITF